VVELFAFWNRANKKLVDHAMSKTLTTIYANDAIATFHVASGPFPAAIIDSEPVGKSIKQ